MAFRVVVGGMLGHAVLLTWSAAALAQQPPAQQPLAQQPSAPAPPSQVPSEAPAAPAVAPAVATPPAAILPAAPPPAPPSAAPPPPSQPRPVAPRPLPNWNVGAGIFAGGDSVFGLSGLSGLAALSTPAYGAAVERRVGPRTWLALNAMGSYENRDLAITPAEVPPIRSSAAVHSLSGSFLLGLRHEIVQSLVNVSIFAAGAISAQRVRPDTLRSSEKYQTYGYTPSNARGVGFIAGMTVERQLVEALALRLSLDIASLSFTRTTTETIDGLGVGTPVSLSARRFGISIRPGLQLHFYF
jgi:hypothetical protein